MQTRDQQYAIAAHKHVTWIKENVNDEKQRKSYGAMSHKLPILIRTTGLAQALVFVEARGNDQHKKLLADLATSINLGSKKELLDLTIAAQLSQYIYLTQQMLAALLWYKRFAQSILGVDASDSGDEKLGEEE